MNQIAIAAELAACGWSVSLLGVSRELCDVLCVAALAADAAGAMSPASIGRGFETLQDATIRGDRIQWLAVTPPWLEELRQSLNRELFLGLQEFEGHLAIYPAGAGYERHSDRHRSGSRRIVSVVLYLNNEWQDEWGGMLNLFPLGDSEQALAIVRPEMGTLVVFMSAEIPHSVAPTLANRLSLSGWFLGPWSA